MNEVISNNDQNTNNYKKTNNKNERVRTTEEKISKDALKRIYSNVEKNNRTIDYNKIKKTLSLKKELSEKIELSERDINLLKKAENSLNRVEKEWYRTINGDNSKLEEEINKTKKAIYEMNEQNKNFFKNKRLNEIKEIIDKTMKEIDDFHRNYEERCELLNKLNEQVKQIYLEKTLQMNVNVNIGRQLIYINYIKQDILQNKKDLTEINKINETIDKTIKEIDDTGKKYEERSELLNKLDEQVVLLEQKIKKTYKETIQYNKLKSKFDFLKRNQITQHITLNENIEKIITEINEKKQTNTEDKQRKLLEELDKQIKQLDQEIFLSYHDILKAHLSWIEQNGISDAKFMDEGFEKQIIYQFNEIKQRSRGIDECKQSYQEKSQIINYLYKLILDVKQAFIEKYKTEILSQQSLTEEQLEEAKKQLDKNRDIDDYRELFHNHYKIETNEHGSSFSFEKTDEELKPSLENNEGSISPEEKKSLNISDSVENILKKEQDEQDIEIDNNELKELLEDIRQQERQMDDKQIDKYNEFENRLGEAIKVFKDIVFVSNYDISQIENNIFEFNLNQAINTQCDKQIFNSTKTGKLLKKEYKQIEETIKLIMLSENQKQDLLTKLEKDINAFKKKVENVYIQKIENETKQLNENHKNTIKEMLNNFKSINDYRQLLKTIDECKIPSLNNETTDLKGKQKLDSCTTVDGHIERLNQHSTKNNDIEIIDSDDNITDIETNIDSLKFFRERYFHYVRILCGYSTIISPCVKPFVYNNHYFYPKLYNQLRNDVYNEGYYEPYYIEDFKFMQQPPVDEILDGNKELLNLFNKAIEIQHNIAYDFSKATEYSNNRSYNLSLLSKFIIAVENFKQKVEEAYKKEIEKHKENFNCKIKEILEKDLKNCELIYDYRLLLNKLKAAYDEQIKKYILHLNVEQKLEISNILKKNMFKINAYEMALSKAKDFASQTTHKQYEIIDTDDENGCFLNLNNPDRSIVNNNKVNIVKTHEAKNVKTQKNKYPALDNYNDNHTIGFDIMDNKEINTNNTNNIKINTNGQ